jgi:hypothetical protein
MGGKSGTKAVYFDKLKGLLDEYKSVFIVGVDKYVPTSSIATALLTYGAVSRLSRCTKSAAP